jgi:flagellar motor switch protein FliM
MDNEVLSQAEVEGLIDAMAGGGKKAARSDPIHRVPPDQDPMNAAALNVAGAVPAGARERIVPYDFKRPERVGKEQIRALQTLHEGFARNFAAGLSAMLRSMVEVKLAGVDQLTFSEFIFSLENPTCLNLLCAEPLEGSLILEINPSILYPIIDRLLGGGREGGPLARRPLTEIELRLVSRINDLFLRELGRAWSNVLELKPKVERVESNPQLVQIVPPNEVVVLISFDVGLGEMRGMVNVCIPYNAIERISGRLSADSWVAYGRREATPESIRQISRSLRSALVELRVSLAETRITTGELIRLRVGDVITTDKDVQRPLLVTVEGIPKFRAAPGAYKGHKAIRVEEVIANPSGQRGD